MSEYRTSCLNHGSACLICKYHAEEAISEIRKQLDLWKNIAADNSRANSAAEARAEKAEQRVEVLKCDVANLDGIRLKLQAEVLRLRKELEWIAGCSCFQGCRTKSEMGEEITCEHLVAREALSSTPTPSLRDEAKAEDPERYLRRRAEEQLLKAKAEAFKWNEASYKAQIIDTVALKNQAKAEAFEQIAHIWGPYRNEKTGDVVDYCMAEAARLRGGGKKADS